MQIPARVLKGPLDFVVAEPVRGVGQRLVVVRVGHPHADVVVRIAFVVVETPNSDPVGHSEIAIDRQRRAVAVVEELVDGRHHLSLVGLAAEVALDVRIADAEEASAGHVDLGGAPARGDVDAAEPPLPADVHPAPHVGPMGFEVIEHFVDVVHVLDQPPTGPGKDIACRGRPAHKVVAHSGRHAVGIVRWGFFGVEPGSIPVVGDHVGGSRGRGIP